MSPDQRFLYVTSFLPGTLRVFSLDAHTGRLVLVQVLPALIMAVGRCGLACMPACPCVPSASPIVACFAD